MVIHTTFQRFAGPGKKARLREFGLWHMDPPEYYGAPSSSSSTSGTSSGGGGSSSTSDSGGGSSSSMRGSLKLLAYDNAVLEFVSELERQRYGGAAAGTAGAAGGAAAAAAGGSTGGGGGSMPLFEKHWLGMSFQLAAFRLVGGGSPAGLQQPAGSSPLWGEAFAADQYCKLHYWCSEGLVQ